MITDPVHERLHYSAQEVCLALGVNDFNRLDEKTQRALQDLAMYCGCSHVPWFSTALPIGKSEQDAESGEFPEGVSLSGGVPKKCVICDEPYEVSSSSTKCLHLTAAEPPKLMTILEEVKHVLECHDLYLVNSTASIPFNDPDTLLVEHAIIARPSRMSPVEKAIRQEKQLEEMMKRVKYVGQEGVATKEYADQAARPLNLKIDDLEVEIAPEEVANLNNDLHDQMLETMKKSGSVMVTPCPVYVRGQGEEQEEE